ncbi:MAG: prolyl oligopeptidase family serine peptidase [Gemmatimonadaceae bacterium]
MRYLTQQSRRTQALAFALACTCGALPLASIHAQTNSGASSTAANSPATSMPVMRDGKKVLNLEDYGRWNRINSTAISSDGKWMTFTYAPNEGTSVLHVKSLDGDKDYTAQLGGTGGGRGAAAGGGRGGAPGGGGAPGFSDDSKWATYFVPPSERGGAAAAGRAGGGGGGGGRGGRGNTPPPQGAAAAPAAAAVGHLELLNLATGEKTPFPNVAAWKFSPGSNYLAMRLNKTSTDTKALGNDLLVRDLATGMNRPVGSVYQYEFDDAGKVLAYTVDAPDKLGNGVYLLNVATGETKQLNSMAAEYDALTWSGDGTNLAVLRGDKAKDMKQKSNVLLTWNGVASGTGKAFVFDPSKDASFPKNMVLSEYTAPRWSRDGSRVFIGLKEQEAEIPALDSIKANVDVWHWKDQSPQSVQIVQLGQLRRATAQAVVFVNTGKFVRLVDDSLRTVAMAPNSNFGVGRNDAAYRGEIAWGGSRADLYRVDVNTGARILIDKGLSRTYGTSPDSKWFLYLKNKQMRAFNLETCNSILLDASLVPGKSFVNEDDDHAYEKPIWGLGGWANDGKTVLLYDKFDVWRVPLDGSKATNLTQGAGKAQDIQFRVVRLGVAGGGGRGGRGGRGGGAAANEEDDGIDMSQPIMLSAYGDRNKKSGYWQVTAGQAPKSIVWEDKNIGGVVKATDADRIIYTQQDFNEFPDVWTASTMFASPKKITDANPILSEYAWSPKKVLIDYTNSKGKKLQGTLMLPAGYEPGKKYPMLVEFYEIMSNTHHNFSTPGYSNSPQLSTYASNGYLVFQPDIVYEIGKPGTSAVDCMTSAVKKVIELGYADPKHIGLHGHSWSGYQSSYIVTQTNMFAAVVTGAPPTNLISFYDELYKSAGTVQQGITTVGQVRMGAGVTPWNAHNLYVEQSPISHVQNIHTPFMILQGMEDGAVDYVEGLQFFNAARSNGKEVILLSYPGEAHNLTNRDNQKDFTIRMKQYFDHYLMDKPAPKWMTDGLQQVNKGGPVR